MRFVFLFFLLGAQALLADILYLKNGSELEGFIESVEEVVTIRTATGTQQIPSDDIRKIEMGYSGIAVCYTPQGAILEICAGILHKLSVEEVLIGKGRGNTEARTFPLGAIKRLSFNKQPGQVVVPVLGIGLNLSLQTSGGEIKGRITRRTGDAIEMETDSGQTRLVPEAEIQSGSYRSPSPFSFRQFVPGLPQFDRGETLKGSLILGSLGGVAAMGFAEYLQASAVNQAASSSMTFMLFNDPSFEAAFQRHQQNQLIAAGLGGLIYGYHLFDAFYGTGRDKTSQPGAILFLGPDHYPSSSRSGATVGLAITWRF
ncbi:MAG: hypothetical protein HS115_03730 [Spirochaetales bacterium]|nr:hypothetical protein [Spirochaetales bacterium]